MNDIKKPFDLLNRSVGKRVRVGVKGGHMFEGVMLAFDVHMNVVLKDAKKEGEEFKSVFIRGDSVVFISPVEA